MNITFDQVVRVYSGKPGCMCGCRGKYRYPKNTEDKDATKSEINDSMVKKVLAVLNSTPEAKLDFYPDEVIAHVEIEERSYVAYLKINSEVNKNCEVK